MSVPSAEQIDRLALEGCDIVGFRSGNGLAESLLIDRKFGLTHTLEAPRLGFQLPFLDKQWQAFADDYPVRVAEMVTRLPEKNMLPCFCCLQYRFEMIRFNGADTYRIQIPTASVFMAHPPILTAACYHASGGCVRRRKRRSPPSPDAR